MKCVLLFLMLIVVACASATQFPSNRKAPQVPPSLNVLRFDPSHYKGRFRRAIINLKGPCSTNRECRVRCISRGILFHPQCVNGKCNCFSRIPTLY